MVKKVFTGREAQNTASHLPGATAMHYPVKGSFYRQAGSDRRKPRIENA